LRITLFPDSSGPIGVSGEIILGTLSKISLYSFSTSSTSGSSFSKSSFIFFPSAIILSLSPVLFISSFNLFFFSFKSLLPQLIFFASHPFQKPVNIALHIAQFAIFLHHFPIFADEFDIQHTR